MAITQNISLTLDTEPPFYRLKMRQGDGEREINAAIYDRSAAWEIPAGGSIEFRAVKPDGTKIVRNDGITYSGNVVTVPITSNTLAVPGNVNCEIVFLNASGSELGTVRFCIEVWAAVVPLADIASTDDYQTLQDAVSAAEGYRDEAQQYAADASTSEANAAASATSAQQASQQAQDARDQYPQIDATTTNWKIYNPETGEYTVTSYPSRGEQGPQGETGPQGPEGTTLTIKGLYATLEALQQAHPTGQAGDAYAVGTDVNNVIYIWDTDTSAWTSIGALQGAPGPQGETGPQGAAATIAVGTVTTGAAGTQATVTNSGTSSAAIFDFTIPQGATGPQGPQGNPTTVNGKSGASITLDSDDIAQGETNLYVTAAEKAFWNTGGAAQLTTATLTSTGWAQQSDETYRQAVSGVTVTANQKVDFDCDVVTAASLPSQIRPYNNNGTLYAVTTAPPESDITVQCTIMNVQMEE